MEETSSKITGIRAVMERSMEPGLKSEVDQRWKCGVTPRNKNPIPLQEMGSMLSELKAASLNKEEEMTETPKTIVLSYQDINKGSAHPRGRR